MPKKGIEMVTPAFEPTQEQLDKVAQIKAPQQKYHLPKDYLSHSQIDMYLRCARQYEFRYVKDEKDPPGIAMVFGSGAHKAVEFTHHHIVDHDKPAPTEQVTEAFSDAFEKRAEAIPTKAWEDEKADRGSLKDAGVRLVQLYNNKVAPSVKPQVKQVNGESVRGIEKRFMVNIAGVDMLGFIDLIDVNDPVGVSDLEQKILHKQGKIVPDAMRTAVVDFKTKTKSLSQGDVDGSFQLTLYSYVEQIPIVRFDQLLNQKVPKVKRVHSGRTVQDHKWMTEIITSVASAISAGIFPPCSPTAWVCGPKWCGYYHQCRGKKR